MIQLKLHFLGPPRLEVNGRIVEPDTRKATALLAYLALLGERLSRDALAAFLWPDFDDSRARAALRRTLSTLRATVGADALYTTREVVGLNGAVVWCDVQAFQEALEQCRTHIHDKERPCPSCRASLEKAADLFRDDFLSGFSLRDSIPFDDWQIIQAEALRRDASHALEALSHQQQLAGELGKGIATAHRWLSLDPLREDAYRQLMLLYAQSGQRAQALQQYRDCVRIFDEELGVAPLAETSALYNAIRDNQILAQTVTPAFSVAQPEPQQRPLLPPLIGRVQELAQMMAVYEQVVANGRVLILEGEAGVGKSRLAQAFLGRLAPAELLSTRCYEGETNLAYAPIAQLLRHGMQQQNAAARLANLPTAALTDVSWLLPELDGAPLPMRETPGAQHRFYDSVGLALDALLVGERPGVLWLDDAHWLDSASLALLLYLLRRWRQRPFLFLFCWRSDALAANSLLARTLTELGREGISQRITLARFSPDEVQQLVSALMPDHPAALPQKLYRETEGLPLFVVEYLNALMRQSNDDASWELPHTVRDLLAARLAPINETERQILQTAAVVGSDFTFELLHLASGRSEEEAVTALEGLLARGLLLEQTEVYDFSHVKLRELVYAQMGLARRRLLHRRVAEALALSAARLTSSPAPAAEIANHYRLAGLETTAAEYFAEAGQRARELFAHLEAVHYFESALALGHDDTAKLHEAKADMHVRLGEYDAALTGYETSASLAEGVDLGRLEHKLAQVYMRQGAWRQAEAQLAQASAELGETAALYVDWSYVAFNLDDPNAARRYAAQAEALAETPPLKALSHNIAGILLRHAGDLSTASTRFAQSLELAQRYDLPDTAIAALNNLALCEQDMGRFESAVSHLKTALALCRQVGDRHREAALHNNLADLYHQTGDEMEAMSALKTSVSIYSEIGGQPGNWQPEIWKLTEW